MAFENDTWSLERKLTAKRSSSNKFNAIRTPFKKSSNKDTSVIQKSPSPTPDNSSFVRYGFVSI